MVTKDDVMRASHEEQPRRDDLKRRMDRTVTCWAERNPT
jgi:hypothetical protein